MDKMKEERRQSLRTEVSGEIIVHNNKDLAKTFGVNISITGLFLETKSHLFSIGEQVKATCRIKGMEKSFNVQAEVIHRQEQTADHPEGYGFKFIKIDNNIVLEIKQLISKENRAFLRSA